MGISSSMPALTVNASVGARRDIITTVNVYTLGTARVENTKNINDFAKTGGEIVAYIALALGLAVAGSLTAAVARRNRARKTA